MSRAAKQFSNAPLCLCCEEVLAEPVYGETLRDPDLNVPVCLDCGEHLCQAYLVLRETPGIYGCAALGPDSGKGVRS